MNRTLLLTLSSCVSALAIGVTCALAEAIMPEGYTLPPGTEMRADGSALLPDGRLLPPEAAASGIPVQRSDFQPFQIAQAVGVEEGAIGVPPQVGLKRVEGRFAAFEEAGGVFIGEIDGLLVALESSDIGLSVDQGVEGGPALKLIDGEATSSTLTLILDGAAERIEIGVGDYDVSPGDGRSSTGPAAEYLSDFSVPPTRVTGGLQLTETGEVVPLADNASGTLIWEELDTDTITFIHNRETNGLGVHLLGLNADIPDAGNTGDLLATTVTSFTSGTQVTLETAVYETLNQTIASFEQSDSIEVSFFASMLTSLYEVREEVATSAVVTVLERHGFSSVTGSIEVAVVMEIIDARGGMGGTGAFHLASHFAAMDSVDMGACGIEQGGFGGFGERVVPTNSHGDVHIFTPDGLTYDFQDGGEFTLVASADGRFEVHTRQTVHSDDASVSSNTAVAIRLGESIVEFYSDQQGQRFYMNGESRPLPTTDFDLEYGGYVQYDGEGKSGPRYLIGWPGEDGSDEFAVRVNLYQAFLNVGVAAQGGTYSGLIGNLDGNPLNDMLPRGGGELLCPPADADFLAWFGDSWRVSAEETLLRAELDESLVALATEIGTGRRVSLETAVYETLETNFASLDASETVEVSFIVTLLTSLYEVSEEVALDMVVNVFAQRGVTTVTDTIEVSTITNVVEVYEERREVRTIETLDVTVRANAQRICEANGVTDQLALANCTLDIAATQDATYVESATSFQELVADVPREQRQIGSSVSNPLAPEAVLSPERVVEIVGPPEVVPTFEQLVTVVQNVTETTTREESVVTQMTSDITSTFDTAACSEVDGLRSPAEVLAENPAAGGVAIYCATHARGQTVTVELGRTLEDALARAEASCPAEAETRIEDFGEITYPCREIGRGEREFDFGGGVLALGRDVQVTLTERRIEKSELLQRVENFSFVDRPVPGVTAACLAGESLPIEGLTVTEGLLDYTGKGESDFQSSCGDVDFIETEDDFLLQATCFNEDATDASTSAISLLGVAAVEELVSHPSCAPETIAEGPFTVLAEDGLEAMFPDRGDFVLIRSETAGIAVHARRDLWVADRSETVFTALVMQIGEDVMEVRAAPEPAVLINGLPFEEAIEQDGEVGVLPSGGRVRIEEDGMTGDALVVMWPETSFAMRLVVHPGSHVSPAIQVDEAFTYEGLARFTQDWMLTEGEGGFSTSLGADPSCNCGDEGEQSAQESNQQTTGEPASQTGFPTGGLGSND